MAYIDSYALPVPEANRQAYIDLATMMAHKLRALGASRVVEAWGDDVPHGKTTDFHRATQAGDDEVVVVSWVSWPDKATRDAGWQAMMTDPDMQDHAMPFDGKRMFWGGFEPIVDVGQG